MRTGRVGIAIMSGLAGGLLVLAVLSSVSTKQVAEPPPTSVPTPAPAPLPPSGAAAPTRGISPVSPPAAERPATDRPSPTAPIAAPSQVDAALRALVAGTVAFRAPSDMTVGKAAEVKVLLSARKQLADLVAQLGSGGQTGGGPALVADRMRATLSGQDFEISPAEPQVQAISRETDNAWSWMVAAAKAGDHVLVLRLDAVLKIDGSDTPHFLETFDKHIKVAVGWPTDFHGWVDLARTTADDFKWLITSLAALGAGAVGWLRKKPAPSS